MKEHKTYSICKDCTNGDIISFEAKHEPPLCANCGNSPKQSVVDEVEREILNTVSAHYLNSHLFVPPPINSIRKILSDYRIEKKSDSTPEPTDKPVYGTRSATEMMTPRFEEPEPSKAECEHDAKPFTEKLPNGDNGGVGFRCELCGEESLDKLGIIIKPSKASGIDEVCWKIAHSIHNDFSLFIDHPDKEKMVECIKRYWPKTPDYEKVADRIRCNIISKRASQPIIEVVLETLKSELGDNK